MRVWNIQCAETEYEIDFGSCTILKGQHFIWHSVIRSIDNFFNQRGSPVIITEDAIPINKKDWKCFFIPFDCKIETEKITAKSPLNSPLADFVSEIALSPSFLELQDVWEEIQEESDFANRILQPFDLRAEVRSFEEADLKSFIQLKSSFQSVLPVNDKMTFLQLIQNEPMDKQILVLMELPEIYSTEQQLEQMIDKINSMRAKGVYFVIVTSGLAVTARKNFIVKNQVVNESAISCLKRQLIVEAPCGIEEEQFYEAKNKLLRIVDNCSETVLFEQIEQEQDSICRLLMYMILRKLGIQGSVDTKGFPGNISSFLTKYL